MKLSATFLVICGLGIILPLGALAADAAAGKATYDAKCKTCHGGDGTGNPAIAKMMKVDMKALGSQSDAEVKTAVTMGVGKMKPIAGVAGGDLDNLVAYVHTLKK
ncbi:MAG TPA: cytochrome c [Bryobacteraceae bacterium]|jgi:mono/diheme cytochrome c family protein|nr:cytochrome c [Bryobacteraceae bacterium]